MSDTKIKFVTASVTTSTSAYSSGNVIGGQMTFTALADKGFCSIMSLVIVDRTGQNVPCDLFLFNQPLTSTITDRAAVSLNNADLANCIGVVSSVATDYASAGTGSVCGKSGKLNLFLGLAGSSDNNVYGLLVARGAATFGSTSAISVGISAEVAIPG